MLEVVVRRYRCSECGHVWRQDTSAAAEPRAKLSRSGLAWALTGIVVQHLTVARIAEGLGVAWDTANSRYRRIFNDRTGLASARNQRPFLLQTYRRDMGGGKFALMKDVSAPITIQGRHWGGFRLGYLV